MNYLIVGLGNIGAEYAETRHNMGFMTLDAFAEASNVSFSTARLGDIAEMRLAGHNVVLLKPSTYMNLSGRAVNYWMQKYKVPKENLLVVVDDLAIPFGTLRMRKKGSDGGHNGLKDIDSWLGSNDYARLRLGIGNGYPRGAQIQFVLCQLEDHEKKELPEVLKSAGEAIRLFVLQGCERAMNVCNTKKKKEKPEIEAVAQASTEEGRN